MLGINVQGWCSDCFVPIILRMPSFHHYQSVIIVDQGKTTYLISKEDCRKRERKALGRLWMELVKEQTNKIRQNSSRFVKKKKLTPDLQFRWIFFIVIRENFWNFKPFQLSSKLINFSLFSKAKKTNPKISGLPFVKYRAQ